LHLGMVYRPDYSGIPFLSGKGELAYNRPER